jgi:hypothetical protein
MTKNGNFCAIMALLFGVASFLTSLAAINTFGWFWFWLVAVSSTSFIGCVVCTYAAICDYLLENEE